MKMPPSSPVASQNQMDKASLKPSGSTEYPMKKYLLLLATLVATVTYAAGLNLPGGVWQEDTEDGHLAGDVILRDTHRNRYLTFYYCNATAFAASLVVCLLLLVVKKAEQKYWEHALRVVMFLDLLGLMGAYVAGSCRDAFTTIYSSVIMSAILAYIVIAFLIYVCSKSEKQGEDAVKNGDSEKEIDEDKREALMLLATFVVTITYVAGLNPPGGFWGNTQEGHHQVSNPILQDSNSSRYQAFFVCNTTAFVASLLIIMLLLDEKQVLSYCVSKLKKISTTPFEKKKETSTTTLQYFALYGFIVIALFGLVGAYAAGSCRELDTTAYVISLIGAVLAYIFLQVSISKLKKYLKSTDTSVIARETEHNEAPVVNVDAGDEATEIANASKAEEEGKQALKKACDLVVLLATLVASITYQAGLDPPGGLWPDDQEGHKGGDPVLLTTHPTRYKVFFYSNSAAFVASLVVIVMARSKSLLTGHILEAAMLLDLFGLIAAYAAGSCRDLSTSIYVVALAGAVLVYVVIHIVFFTLEDHHDHEDAKVRVEKRREVLLLLAILVATLTYQAGLTPPGGFWLDDTLGHHAAGVPVLQDNYPRRYNAFFYCNATSFMASVALIVLLVNPHLYKPGIQCYALYVCMVAGMFGLMGAYAAGSSRQLRTSIYVLTLVAAVFAFVILQVVIFFWFPNKKEKDVESSRSRAETTKEKEEALKQEKKELKEKRDKDLQAYLMLLGVLAASVTYQTGLKPPGGLWQDNSNGHIAGNSILHDINRGRYHAFFYSNSTSFMASIVVVVLLLPWTLHKHELKLWPLHTAIVLNMLSLLGAYAAGSSRDWETSRNVLCLVIPMLASIAAYAVWSLLGKKGPCKKGTAGVAAI